MQNLQNYAPDIHMLHPSCSGIPDQRLAGANPWQNSLINDERVLPAAPPPSLTIAEIVQQMQYS
jgi:hypothetical protein